MECGVSGATSGLSANPAVWAAVDLMVDQGGRVIFSEVPELLGADEMLLSRAVDHSCRDLMRDALRRASRLGQALGMFAISTGNHAGGLTTIEEKSLGPVRSPERDPFRA